MGSLRLYRLLLESIISSNWFFLLDSSSNKPTLPPNDKMHHSTIMLWKSFRCMFAVCKNANLYTKTSHDGFMLYIKLPAFITQGLLVLVKLNKETL